jgi:hypothetical protein
MLTRLIATPAVAFPRGANQMRQRGHSRDHFRRVEASPVIMIAKRSKDQDRPFVADEVEQDAILSKPRSDGVVRSFLGDT